MRKLCLFAALALILLPTALPTGAGRAQTSGSAPQQLFLGDRDCGDNWTDCLFNNVIAAHRYLHVILHDYSGDPDWQVQAGAVCTANVPTLASGQPVADSGYLEGVIDLGQVAPALIGQPACFLLRGRNHWTTTFYAAYFDDSPSSDAESVLPGYQSLNGLPDLPDLDVTYIHRDPALAYDARPNTPHPGEQAYFHAHVRNAGFLPSGPFLYTWMLDGHVLVGGNDSRGLTPGGEETFSLPWTWRSGHHTLRFVVVPDGPEINAHNKALSIRTDALSLGFWVEQSAWEYFNHFQWLYCRSLPCIGSNSFADWLQRQVAAWNRLLDGARSSPDVPSGIIDRVRLDKITVVPDGSLPLHGGRPTNSPDLSDHTVDLQWGLPAQGVDALYRRHFEGPFDVDWAQIHELGHARSLADLYRFDVLPDGSAVAGIRDTAGQPIFDSSLPSSPMRAFQTGPTSTLLYQNAEDDLMSCTCTPLYSPYDALLWNRIQGRRPTCGNFNPPCNLGDWFLDLPRRNGILLLDRQGQPLPDSTRVRMYYDGATDYIDHRFTTGNSQVLPIFRGKVWLGSDPFHVGGSHSLAGPNLLLMEVQTASSDTFCFIEPTLFNLARWHGYADSNHPAMYVFQQGRQVNNRCNLRGPPPLVNEPFAASLADSSVVVTPQRGREIVVHITLYDASRPAHPLRDRLLALENAHGHVLATALTGLDGAATVVLRHVPGRIAVVDRTDNNLIIPAVGPYAPRNKVR
ncbi:MAG: hypothetical protein ACR2GA_02215 [Chloroflexota bacterium]